MTLEAWVKLNQAGAQGALLSRGSSSQGNYRVLVMPTGKIQFTWDATTGQSQSLTSTAAVTDLAWHHMACVYDAENAQMRLYLDGKLSGTLAATGTPKTGTDPLYLGARQSSSSLRDFFKGRIDLVQISSAATRSADFTPPTSLGSTSAGGYVTLRWTLPQIGLVRGYNLYRQVDGEYPAIRKLNGDTLYAGTTYTDKKPHIGSNCYWVAAVNAHGVEGLATQTSCIPFAAREVPVDAGNTPRARGLSLQVSPNPFNPTTRVSFHLERAATVVFSLHDVAGRRLREWKMRDLAAGNHAAPLPLGADGRKLASGIYFLRLRAGGQSDTARLVVLK